MCPPELNVHGTFETKNFASINEPGYRAARDQMDTIVGLVNSSAGSRKP